MQAILQSLSRRDYIKVWQQYSQILQNVIGILMNHDTNLKRVVTALINEESDAHLIIVATLRYLIQKSKDADEFITRDNVAIAKKIMELRNIADIPTEDVYFYPPFFQNFLKKIIGISLEDAALRAASNTSMTIDEAKMRRDVYLHLSTKYKMINGVSHLQSSLWFLQLDLMIYIYTLYIRVLEDKQNKDEHINNLNLVISNSKDENVTKIEELNTRIRQLVNLNDALNKERTAPSAEAEESKKRERELKNFYDETIQDLKIRYEEEIKKLITSKDEKLLELKTKSENEMKELIAVKDDKILQLEARDQEHEKLIAEKDSKIQQIITLGRAQITERDTKIEEFKTLETNNWEKMNELIKSHDQELQRVRSDNEKYIKELSEKNSIIERGNRTLEELRMGLSDREEKINQMQRDINEINEKTLSGDRPQASDSLDIKAELEGFKGDLYTARESIEELRSVIKHQEETIKSKDSELKECNTKSTRLYKELENENYKLKMEFENQLKYANEYGQSLRNSLAEKDEIIKNLRIRETPAIMDVNDDYDIKSIENEKLKTQLRELKDKYNEEKNILLQKNLESLSNEQRLINERDKLAVETKALKKERKMLVDIFTPRITNRKRNIREIENDDDEEYHPSNKRYQYPDSIGRGGAFLTEAEDDRVIAPSSLRAIQDSESSDKPEIVQAEGPISLENHDRRIAVRPKIFSSEPGHELVIRSSAQGVPTKIKGTASRIDSEQLSPMLTLPDDDVDITNTQSPDGNFLAIDYPKK